MKNRLLRNIFLSLITLTLWVNPVMATTLPYTPKDVDQLTRTVIGEALGESTAGRIAVLNSIRNRFFSDRLNPNRKRSLTEIVRKPGAYSAWLDADKGGNNLVKKGPGDKDYESVKNLVISFLNGTYGDNTGGATHYYAQKQINAPGYYNQAEYKGAQKNYTTIGDHTFMATPADKVSVDFTKGDGVFLGKSKALPYPMEVAKGRDERQRLMSEMLMSGAGVDEDSLLQIASVLKDERDKKQQSYFEGAKNIMNALGSGLGSLFGR